MGLTADIEKAFLKSIGVKEGGDDGEIPQLAKDLSEAIITFLTAQTFTITELKASLEVEEISTIGPLIADVLPSVTVATTGGPGNVLVGTKGVLIPAIKMRKYGGQGGMMTATGHAYVGKESRKVPKSDTIEEFNDFTKVQLDPDKVVEK